MKYFITILLFVISISAEARFIRGNGDVLSRGDVVCDITTGVATGVGSGTCATTPAVCNGDVASVTTNITTVDFGSTVTVFSNTFTAGDIGKAIFIPGSGAPENRTITSVGAFSGGSQAVGVTPVLRANITNQSAVVTYGTDDSPAFATFNSWAVLTWQASHTGLVEMFAPPGKTCQILTVALNTPASNYDAKCANTTIYWSGWCSYGGAGWSKGIRKFLMNFAGSSVVSSPAFSNARFDLAAGGGVCQTGITQANGCSARTASASIGATSITLLDTSLCSRFTTGQYMFMTGYDIQGLYQPTGGYSFPPNPAFYDHVKITDKSNCDTGLANGTITFTPALTNNYLSTWPLNGPGAALEADQGGPATVYAVAPYWDTEVEYRGGTFSRQTALTNNGGRKVTFRDITWSAPAGTSAIGCAYATQNTDWIIIGGNWTNCTVETDKIVVNMTVQDATMYRMDNQSMSPRYTTVSNSTIDIWSGSGRNFTGTNVIVATGARTSPTGYGRNDSWNCTNCTIAGLIDVSTPIGTGTVAAGVWSLLDASGNPQSATMSAGVITVPVAIDAVSWAIPGTNITWNYTGAGESSYMYQVVSVTQDATNQYITTNCVGVNTVCGAGGTLPIASGTLGVRPHPAPKFNCINCTAGSRQWAAVSDGPTDAPLFSYAKYTVDVSWPTATSTAYQFRVWGKLTGITATVNTPYAGGGVLNWKPTGAFLYSVVGQTGTTGSYVPSIDLKTGGTRTLLPGGTGGIGADTNTTPFAAPLWFALITAGVISSQPAWAGNAVITIITDQNVVNP